MMGRNRGRQRETLGNNRVVILSIGLALLLLSGVIAALTVPTMVEFERAERAGLDRTGFAAAGYAERIGALLDKADHLSSSAARLSQYRDGSEAYRSLRDSLGRDVRWSPALDGFVTLASDGTITDMFLKGRTDMRTFSGQAAIDRNRDHWSGPVVRVARPLGRQAWFLAVERGEWTQDGVFTGVGIAFLSLQSALNEAVVGKLFDRALIRLQDLDGALLFESRSGEEGDQRVWISAARQKAFLEMEEPDSLGGVAVGRTAGLFLASQRVPGLPLIVSVQIPEAVFMAEALNAGRMALAVAAGAALTTLLVLAIIIRDQAVQRQAQRQLRDAEERLQFALFAGRLSLWELIFRTGALQLSDRTKNALGYRRGGWGQGVRALLRHMHSDDRPALRALWRQIRAGDISRCSLDFRLHTADGRWLWCRAEGRVAEREAGGMPTRMIGVLHDISAEKGREATLTFAATHDPLLGLLNRKVFDDACAVPCGPERPHSLIVFDIDHFKRVNDTYGHGVGDMVLKAVTGRIRAAAPSGVSAHLYRIGGEEFALLLDGTASDMAVEVAERLCQAVAITPVQAGDVALSVSASFGVCGSDQIAAAVVGDLFAPADAALYRAKESGRNRVVCHGPVGDGVKTCPLAECH